MINLLAKRKLAVAGQHQNVSHSRATSGPKYSVCFGYNHSSSFNFISARLQNSSKKGEEGAEKQEGLLFPSVGATEVLVPAESVPQPERNR